MVIFSIFKIIENKNLFQFFSSTSIFLTFSIGCKRSGVYGFGCNIQCPTTCKDKTCHIEHGACFECQHGVFGSDCNIPCPVNCKNKTCHIQNGTCFGCEPGWTGMSCNTSMATCNVFIFVYLLI